MGSIIGDKKWHNAVSDLASVNGSIADVTQQLTVATTQLNQALTAIASCNNSASGCLANTGRHISSWRDQRDQYGPLVDKYKADLKQLLDIQKSLAGSTVETSQSMQVAANAQQAITEANSAASTGNLTKYLIIGGIILVALVAGVIIFKQLKKK
jgi:ABC-type transporter Mla subunit MlaD